MKKKKNRTITYNFVAETSITIDIPNDFPVNTADWEDKHWAELNEKAEDEVAGEEADWNRSYTDPSISS